MQVKRATWPSRRWTCCTQRCRRRLTRTKRRRSRIYSNKSGHKADWGSLFLPFLWHEFQWSWLSGWEAELKACVRAGKSLRGIIVSHFVWRHLWYVGNKHQMDECRADLKMVTLSVSGRLISHVDVFTPKLLNCFREGRNLFWSNMQICVKMEDFQLRFLVKL